jgi:glycosyltransferase involved in cell wall biosynthesis
VSEDWSLRSEIEALQTEGFDVSVVCLRGEGEAPAEIVDGVEIHRFAIGDRTDNIWRFLFNTKLFGLLTAARLAVTHLTKRLQLVQFHNPPDYLVFAAWWLRLAGVKIIVRIRDPVPEYFATRYNKWYHTPVLGLLRLTERLALKMAHRVIVENREMRENLGEHGADVNKITVVLGVADEGLIPVDEYQTVVDQVADAKKDERRRGTFSIVSHISAGQGWGIDVVVEAVAKLQDRLPGLVYRAIGRGRSIDDGRRLAERLKVSDRIHFLGYPDPNELGREILAADVGIVAVDSNPYTSLLHPKSIYDYIALRKPVIAPRLRALESYFPEDSLLYFRPGDADDLAEKIYSVFAYPEEITTRVNNATDIYEAHRWERERKKYVGVYRQVLDYSPKHPLD